MVAAIGLGVSMVGGYVNSKNQKSAADKAAANQQSANAGQLKLGNDQLDFGKQQYGDWKDNFNPALKQLYGLANQQQRPDYDAITHDAGAAYDASNATASRNLERYGVNPGDGAFAAEQNGNALAKANTIVGTRNNARTAAQNQQFQRLQSYYQLGNGQQGNANSVINAASAGMNGAYQNQSNQAANQYNTANNNANSSMNGVWQGAGYGIQQYGGKAPGWFNNTFGNPTQIPNSPSWGVGDNGGSSGGNGSTYVPDYAHGG